MNRKAPEGVVLVRLGDVPLDIRVRVATEIIQRGGLRGLQAIEVQLAARTPNRRTAILVPREKADRVLIEGKLPLGQMPKVWTW